MNANRISQYQGMAELSAEEMSNIQGGLSVAAVIAIIIGIGVAVSAIGDALVTAIANVADSVQGVIDALNNAFGGGQQNQN